MSTGPVRARESAVIAECALPPSSSPIYMTATLAASDFTLLAAALGISFALWRFVNPGIPHPSTEMFILPMCCIGVFACTGQYPGVGLNAVEHLRRSSKAVTSVYLMFLLVLFLEKAFSANSRGALVLAWILSVILVPGGRCLTTLMMVGRPWWGLPVLVIGAGRTGRATVRSLRANLVLGYRPVAYLDDDPRKRGICDGIPVAGSLDDASAVASQFGVGYAILAIPDMPRDRMVKHLERWRRIFPRILIIPERVGICTQWTEPKDLGGLTGFETHQKLLNPMAGWVKRTIDVIAASIGLIVAAPLVGLCALWIRKTSPGNPFYVQEREGRQGTTLRILKLRTMFLNADSMLESHLTQDPSAGEEWGRFCKLRNDPRILPGVGYFLRKTSLDELPQLWNILKGEMSLVGPRPFPAYHNSRFDPEFLQVRRQVRPGLTGLWQVSARSDGDLSVQQMLDSYYIRNWSLWLDAYILLRTVRAVLAPRGSY
jgi:Undecaprenyl-phosphate galactose phosphotransferase WbaP